MGKLIWLSVLALCACAHEAVEITRTPADDHHDHAAMMSKPAPDCSQTGWSETVTPAQQKVINAVMGTREHRLHHALWHATRGGLSPAEESLLTSSFGPSWAGARPLCPSPKELPGDTYNPVGEDFLYMHRDMISMLRSAFIAAGLPCIKGWDHVPSLSEFAPPDSDRTGAKSNEALARLQEWDRAFRNPEWLRAHTLSQVGWSLEKTLHDNLHMRFATTNPPKGYPDAAPVTFDGKFPVSWTYDKPAYNWLADPYGAALNPTFWKIHGYVDSIIDRWLEANRFTSIAENCDGLASCYEWKGKWVGQLTLPKNLPGNDRVSRGIPTGDAGGGSGPNVREFTKARMRLQRLGVLTDSDLQPPKTRGRGFPDEAGTGVSPDNDPYLFAKARICRER